MSKSNDQQPNLEEYDLCDHCGQYHNLVNPEQQCSVHSLVEHKGTMKAAQDFRQQLGHTQLENAKKRLLGH